MAKSGLTKDKIYYEFDPFKLAGVKPPKGSIQEAKEAIANYVKEQVLSYIGQGESPVEGGDWKKKISPEYAKRKKELSSSLFANMELTGEMLDALDVVLKQGKKLSLQITGKDQVAKADGHNNFSGKSELPERDSIPNTKKGQTFKDDIIAGIRDIIEGFEEDSGD